MDDLEIMGRVPDPVFAEICRVVQAVQEEEGAAE